MPGRVERYAHLVVAGEPQVGQHSQRLVAHRPHALNDRRRVGVGMTECKVQVVQHRQPGARHAVSLGRSLPFQLPSMPLA
jgi:hypothetical protein